MLNYQKILDKNMINVFIDIMKNIKKNGFSDGNHLYITFLTAHKNVNIPKWLIDKYPSEMTIVLQYEYYDLKIDKTYFEISLLFNDIKANLKISYDAIISFADPSANFGLRLKERKTQKKINKSIKDEKIINHKDNIIDFLNYKKN